MRRKAPESPLCRLGLKFHGFTLLTACIAALGAALVLARILAQGPQMSGDSIFYVVAANSLLDGQGYLDLLGRQVADYPPLFSALLAAAGFVSLTPLQAAGWINATALGLSIFIGGQWLGQRIASRFLAVWACLAIALPPFMASAAHYAWAEPTFILFTTLALLQMDRFLSAAKRSSLIWAATFAALACMTRYIGIALIPLALGLLFFQRGVPVREKLKRMGAFAAIAATPIGIWLGRNHLASGTLMGHRPPADKALAANAQDVLEGLTDWGWGGFAAIWEPGGIAIGATAALAAAAPIFLGCAFIRWRRAEAQSGSGFVVLNGGFALIYLALLTAAATSVGLTPIDHRYLSPAYMPLLFTALLAIDRILQRWPAWAVAASAAMLCLWMASFAHDSLRGAWAVAANPPAAWSARYWEESPVLASLRRQSPDGRIFNNAQPVLRLFYFRELAESQRSNLWLPSSKQDLGLQMRKGDFVVWIHDTHYARLRDYGLADLRGMPELETVGEFADGALFRFKEANQNGGDEARSAAALLAALGRPVARSNFDLFLEDGELIYLKAPCARAEVRPWFFLHVFPSEIEHPAFPEGRKQHGFDNLDFQFDRWGARMDGACLVSRRLPSYGIARIVTGQYMMGGDQIWSAGFRPPSSSSSKNRLIFRPPP